MEHRVLILWLVQTHQHVDLPQYNNIRGEEEEEEEEWGKEEEEEEGPG